MKFFAEIIGMLSFGKHALRVQAERRASIAGVILFCIGFLAYAIVRNSVYAVLPEIASQFAPDASFLNLNIVQVFLRLVQALLFHLIVYVPTLILLGNLFGRRRARFFNFQAGISGAPIGAFSALGRFVPHCGPSAMAYSLHSDKIFGQYFGRHFIRHTRAFHSLIRLHAMGDQAIELLILNSVVRRFRSFLVHICNFCHFQLVCFCIAAFYSGSTDLSGRP